MKLVFIIFAYLEIYLTCFKIRSYADILLNDTTS